MSSLLAAEIRHREELRSRRKRLLCTLCFTEDDLLGEVPPFALPLPPSSPPGYRESVAEKMRGENLATQPRIFPPGSSLPFDVGLPQEMFTLCSRDAVTGVQCLPFVDMPH
jgi:hypothetical protein